MGQARPLGPEVRGRAEARRREATEGRPRGRVQKHVEETRKRQRKDAVVRAGRAQTRRDCESDGGWVRRAAV